MYIFIITSKIYIPNIVLYVYKLYVTLDYFNLIAIFPLKNPDYVCQQSKHHDDILMYVSTGRPSLLVRLVTWYPLVDVDSLCLPGRGLPQQNTFHSGVARWGRAPAQIPGGATRGRGDTRQAATGT